MLLENGNERGRRRGKKREEWEILRILLPPIVVLVAVLYTLDKELGIF